MRKKDHITITLIIPVYNVEKYLKQCLDSVVNQSNSFDEVLLINDGSTDNSLEICQDYASTYGYFKLINQKNKGLSSARNVGIKYASSRYIMFLDSDDYLRLDTVKLLKGQLQKVRYDAIFFDANIYCEYQCPAIRRNFYDRSLANLDGIMMSGWDYFVRCYPRNYVISACMAVYRTDVITNAKIRFPDGLYYEDNYFTFQFLNHAQKVIHISEKIYQRRFRENSITIGQYSEKKFIDFVKINNLIRKNIVDNYYNTLLNPKEPLLAFISDYCIMILDNYQICRNQNIMLSMKSKKSFENAIRNYIFLLKDASINILDLNLSLLNRILIIFHYANLWELNKKKDLTFLILKIVDVQKKKFIKILQKLPLNKAQYTIGIYGTGKHTEGLLKIYEKLVGKVFCNLVFIDSRVDNESYDGKKLIHYKKSNSHGIDLIIISSFIYEQEMISKLKEIQSVLPVYTFYNELNGDIFSRYEVFLEYC